MAVTAEHLLELRVAFGRLENVPLGVRLANAVGRPVEALTTRLPGSLARTVSTAVGRSLAGGMRFALTTLRDGDGAGAQLKRHKALVATTGAAGGFFGAAGIGVELPVTTVVMLRAIGAVARENGEDLTDPAVALECLGVLAHGGPSPKDDATETSYYAARAALAPGIQRAATYLAAHASGELPGRYVPIVLRVLRPLVARFGEAAVQKAIAQAVPFVGAATGAAVNVAFTGYFQNVALGHFTVRRLERLYGTDEIRRAYEAFRNAPGAAGAGSVLTEEAVAHGAALAELEHE